MSDALSAYKFFLTKLKGYETNVSETPLNSVLPTAVIDKIQEKIETYYKFNCEYESRDLEMFPGELMSISNLLGLKTSITDRKMLALALLIMLDIFDNKNDVLIFNSLWMDDSQTLPKRYHGKLSNLDLEDLWVIFSTTPIYDKVEKFIPSNSELRRGRYYTLDDLIEECDLLKKDLAASNLSVRVFSSYI